MGLLHSLGVCVLLFLAIVLLPGVPPKTTFPLKSFSISPTKELTGSLALNSRLDKGERLFEGRLIGPEHILIRNNEIYTGIHGGEVVKINADSDHITHVAQFGQKCENTLEEARCGRPLGMAFDTIANSLVVADAYFGIWLVDLKNGKRKLLVTPAEVLGGNVERKAKFFNSVALDKAGNIYWTDLSSDFTMEDVLFTTFTNPSGRLFFYDRSKNTSTVLLDGLLSANGVSLSPNEEFIVVAETGASRLLKYHLHGPKKGEKEVFVDGLPGNPDNLTPDEHGIWVPLVIACDSEHPSLFAKLSEFPTIRLFILRLSALVEMPFRMLNNVFPNALSQKVLHFIGSFEAIGPFLPNRATIVRVDWNGNVVGALHGFDKSVGHVSHVAEFGEYLLLGSPFNPFMGKVKIPKGLPIKPILPSKARETRTPTTTTTTNVPENSKTVPNTTTTPRRPSTTITTPTTAKPNKAMEPKPAKKEPTLIVQEVKEDTSPPKPELIEL